MTFTSKIIGLCLALCVSLPASALQTDLPKINVLADPSLSIAISSLARQFSHDHGISVTASYAPAKAHSDNIVAGLDADVFITTNQNLLNKLQLQGLLDVYSKMPVSKNRLVLATYAANPLDLVLIPKLPLAAILQQTDPDFSFAVGDPQFHSSGSFAMRALRNYGMAGDLEPYTLFIRGQHDLRRTIAQQGGYGIMYQSDARGDPQLKILSIYPEEAHSPITYYAMVVAGEHMNSSRRFIEYLTSERAQEVFARSGFEALAPEPIPVQ